MNIDQYEQELKIKEELFKQEVRKLTINVLYKFHIIEG